MIKLVAFLGNHGETYRMTRHNCAWQFADMFLPVARWSSKFCAEIALCDSDELKSLHAFCCETANLRQSAAAGKILFVKPMTLMNLSGEAIGAAASFYKIVPDEILIVHDELELPLGTVSLKFSGGLAGHNGLRSAKSCLGTADFWRFRIGIGRPEGKNVADYVLSNFSAEERKILSGVFAKSCPCVQSALFFGAETLLPQWSKRQIL